ncbi:AAA family ATPase [Mycolicibacterium lutetiense]|uniref:DNA helicase DnaB-like N-terminal domain-containing protein n=1 Tax=Mycolicibacterium lutetiense TaxID=1641992 RepID=A0ABS4ZSS2_9MYCO|nr:AAA family ATPase [Mycolicibacterium lutetiense]MBP2452524.1 hypothetical protein [Mycolicibacterium lutetiense]
MADIIERKLLAQMMTADGMAQVVEAKVAPDLFVEPVHRAIFEWMHDYRDTSDGKTPTRDAIEYQFPGRGLPDTVEEDTGWLIGQLRDRHVINHAQDLLRDVAKTVNDDPIGTIERMAEAARVLHEQIGKNGSDSDSDAPRLWSAADLKPAEQPRWLAKNRLPRGAVSLLVGDEGIGKSLFWVYLTAAITTGKPLLEFGVPARDPGHVVIVVTEDDWSTTVRPRLEVAGAELDMVRVICAEEDGSGAPEFPRDLHLISQADPAPALVVVDAWLDTVPSRFDVRNPQAARQALHPWREVAVTTDAAVLLLTHTNRVASANPRDKYGATGELRKKARMTLFAQRDEDGGLVIGPDKANTTAAVMASRFTVRGVQHFNPTDDHDGMVPRLAYAGETGQTAQEHIAEAYTAGRGTSAEDNPVVGWLASHLADGPRWATDVYSAAKETGYSVDQTKRAKKRLSVEAKKDGASAWYWRLPGHEGSPSGGQGSADASV